MSAIRILPLAAALAGALAVPAPAQTAAPATPAAQPAFPTFAVDTNQPISVEAESFVGQTRQDVYTYAGNVIVVQGTIRLRADELAIHAPEGQARTMEARGNVAFVSPSGTAQGARAVYDVGTRVLQVQGGVVLTQGDNVMRGGELEVALETGVATLKGGAASAGRPGRVQGLFSPQGGQAQQPQQSPAAQERRP